MRLRNKILNHVAIIINLIIILNALTLGDKAAAPLPRAIDIRAKRSIPTIG